MSRFLGRVLRALVVLLVLAALAVAWLVYLPVRRVPAAPATDATVLLGQGWGERLDAPPRQAFYWTPQGASLAGVRYDWLVHLEMPWGSRRFADPAHLRGYGFVVDDAADAGQPGTAAGRLRSPLRPRDRRGRRGPHLRGVPHGASSW